MVMKMMGFVQMGGHQYLKTPAPQFLCQTDADLMGQCRGTLSRSKGLIPVKCHDPLILSIPLFNSYHFITRGGGRAVDPGNILLHDLLRLTDDPLLSLFPFPSGLFCIDRIGDHIRKALHFFFTLYRPFVFISRKFCDLRSGGLFRVLYIDHDFPQPTFYTPDGCGSHLTLLSGFHFSSVPAGSPPP